MADGGEFYGRLKMHSVACPDPIRSHGGVLLPKETLELLARANDDDLFEVKRDGTTVCLTLYQPSRDHMQRWSDNIKHERVGDD